MVSLPCNWGVLDMVNLPCNCAERLVLGSSKWTKGPSRIGWLHVPFPVQSLVVAQLQTLHLSHLKWRNQSQSNQRE